MTAPRAAREEWIRVTIHDLNSGADRIVELENRLFVQIALGILSSVIDGGGYHKSGDGMDFEIELSRKL